MLVQAACADGIGNAAAAVRPMIAPSIALWIRTLPPGWFEAVFQTAITG
jgi:hypothetical protein